MRGEPGMEKLVYNILSLFDRSQEPVNSSRVARLLSAQGIDLSERTVRYHLHVLEQHGYIQGRPRKGRVITEKGRQELSRSFVYSRVGGIINKIQNFSFLTDFNTATRQGRLMVNVCYIDETLRAAAIHAMAPVLCSPFSFSSSLLIRQPGDRIGDFTVPRSRIGIGTVCSMSLSGIMLKMGIPMTPRYGGTVQIVAQLPRRFTSFIGYEQSSVAPLEIFMKSGMTDVTGAATSGTGEVLGSFCEIPGLCLTEVRVLCERLRGCGMGGTVLFGMPNQPVLGMPVTPGKAGMVVLSGLNPIAALIEAGIEVQCYALDTLCAYEMMTPVASITEDDAAAGKALQQAVCGGMPYPSARASGFTAVVSPR